MAKRIITDGPKNTVLLYGPSGSGKTCAFLTLLQAGMRGLVFDWDGQASQRLSSFVKKKQVEIMVCPSYNDTTLWLSKAWNGKFPGLDFLGFDTLTIANEEFIREGDEGSTVPKTKPKIPTWDDRRPGAEMIFNIIRWGTRLSRPDSPTPMHTIFTAHESTIEDKLTKALLKGPALPGRFVQRGSALFQEMYHLTIVQDEDDPTKVNHWYTCKNDGNWPAKGSNCLEMYEEANLAAVFEKIAANT